MNLTTRQEEGHAEPGGLKDPGFYPKGAGKLAVRRDCDNQMCFSGRPRGCHRTHWRKGGPWAWRGDSSDMGWHMH